MLGEGFAHGLAPREGAHGAGLVLRRLFSGQRILGRRGFQVLELQLQLIDQPRTPRRTVLPLECSDGVSPR